MVGIAGDDLRHVEEHQGREVNMLGKSILRQQP
jgi:hypothetical protein